MAHEFSKTKPLGGLDTDTEVRSLAPIDYLYGLNLRNAITETNKRGTLTNTKGNVRISKYTCPYNNTTTLPAGTNKCIGAFEEPKFNTVIFLVWNSQGKHGIYRYYRNKIDPTNPYGAVEQVMQYDFDWTKQLRITSGFVVYGDVENDDNDVGDLFYWTDPVPHKINLTKGNVVGKLKSWNVYLPITLSLPSIVNIDFKNFAGAVISPVEVLINFTTDRNAAIQQIADTINQNPFSVVTAVACDCSLQFIEKVAGTVWTITSSTNQILISPDNWYGANLIPRFFDRCKYPPLQAPQPTFEQDPDYEPNYVQKKVFQFRLEYIYDDREQSALGVWSQIPINNLGCDGTSNVAYNYIDVNFNDPLVVDPTVLVLLKKIRVIARELNTGKDRSILDLEPCDFLDFANGEFIAHYNFYNTVISSAVDDVTAAKLFDDVPRESEAEVWKENRVVEGNCLTGYNPPDCIDAKFQMEFGSQPNPTLYKITGLIRIFNYRLDNNASLPDENDSPNILERRGAISYDTAMTYGDVSYPFFGGYFEASSALVINSDFAFNKKRQYLPEGGWPVYAAGTDYFTISRQRSINDVAQRADGSLDVSTTVNKDLVKDFYDTAPGGDMFSTFELNVPAGEYVIRLASHWCSFGDKLGKGFMYNLSTSTSYQKTSTYVWGINDSPLGGGYRYDYEIKVTVTNSDVHIGEFIVADLVFPGINDDNVVYPSHSGYLYDNFGATDVPSLAKGAIVDRALVRNTVFNESSIYRTYHQKITDHNGFFYTFPDIDFNSTNTYANRFLAIQVNGDIHTSGTQYYEDVNGQSALQLLFEQVITPSYPHDPIPSHLEIILPTDNQNARLQSSTFVSGTVVDTNNNPLGGVMVLVTHGRFGTTASNGTYSILIWGDMQRTPPFSAPVNIRQDFVVFNLGVSCGALYPNGQEVFFSIDGSADPALGFGANTSTNPPPYSPTAVYPVPLFIIDETNNPAIKAHKRGGNYTYGIRLYDSAGRLCTVVRAFEMYVPFITEDIGRYQIENFSGVVYPTNTFLYGKPSIKYVLAANTVFPAWATTMQWMRTLNSIYGRYLQWVANQVTYLSATAQSGTPEIETSFQNGDAVAIRVSIKNIVDFAAQNPTSTISYSYIAGDRLRLIYDRSLNPINGLNDFEITSYDPTTLSLLVKTEGFTQEILSGTVFEVFNPQSVATEDEQLYYEVGEVINVTNGIPEKFDGVFTNGDTYWGGIVITVNDEATKFASAYPIITESASVSPFYISQAQDIGRIGIIDDNFREVRRPMLLKASNQFIPSTAINGLSSFEALNEKELDRNSGAIKMLVSVNQTVVAVSTLRETSNYIQVVTFQQATQGQGVLAIADQFFGTQYPHSKTLGTDLPATIVTNDSKIWGWINQRANVWKYKGDGEDTISDLKMINYFQGLQQDGVTDAVATYYRYTKEYIITLWRKYQYAVTGVISITPEGRVYLVSLPFVNGTPLPKVGENITVQCLLGGIWVNKEVVVNTVDVYPDGAAVTFSTVAIDDFNNAQQLNVVYSLPETIAWFDGEGGERWVTFYSFTPEAYSMIGSELMAFKDGEPWIQDKNPVYNNFFGVQYDTRVTPVFNLNPEFLKVWNTVVLQTKQDNNACDWSVPVITNDNNQLSRLNKAGWVKKGETFYAPFKRDLNDLTVAPNLRISQGRALRSSTLTCEMINDYNGEMSLYLWSANVTNSERTSK